jgi:hypothetical protein
MAEPAKKLSADDLLPLAKKLPRSEQLRLARTLLKPEPAEPSRREAPRPAPAGWEPPLLRAGGRLLHRQSGRRSVHAECRNVT